MEWNRGYSALFYISRVDRDSWRSVGRYEFTEGSVTRQNKDLRQSADLKFHNEFTHSGQWLRIHAIVKQGDTSETVSLFTGIATSPSRDIDGYRSTYNAELYSVLFPADKNLLPIGWYVPTGSNGAIVIRELLDVTPAPVVLGQGISTLSQSIIAEKNETRLSMIEKILEAINWRLYIDGDGTIHVEPKAQDAVITYDPVINDSIEPKITEESDRFDCPNVYRAISDDISAVARDDDPESELSTVSRGMEIWEQDTSCKLNDGESLASYAMRMLKERQNASVNVSYDRRFNPDVNVTDIVNLNYPAQGIVGLYTVDKQTIELGHNIRTSEEVIRA